LQDWFPDGSKGTTVSGRRRKQPCTGSSRGWTDLKPAIADGIGNTPDLDVVVPTVLAPR